MEQAMHQPAAMAVAAATVAAAERNNSNAVTE